MNHYTLCINFPRVRVTVVCSTGSFHTAQEMNLRISLSLVETSLPFEVSLPSHYVSITRNFQWLLNDTNRWTSRNYKFVRKLREGNNLLSTPANRPKRLAKKFVRETIGEKRKKKKIQSSRTNNHSSNPLVEANVTPSLYRGTTNCPYHFSSFERRQSVRDVGHAIRRANEGIEFHSLENRKRRWDNIHRRRTFFTLELSAINVGTSRR